MLARTSHISSMRTESLARRSLRAQDDLVSYSLPYWKWPYRSFAKHRGKCGARIHSITSARSQSARLIRIVNTLTAQTQYMTVCNEDSIYDIQQKYKQRYNHHAGSYEWRKFSNGVSPLKMKYRKNITLLQYNIYQGKSCSILNLNGTLDENGLTDDEDSNVELPPPSIWLYYTDDITIA